MEFLSKETFLNKIFNYEEEKEWSFKGDKPAVIDFYADWCGPCKMLGPILEELATEYDGKIDIYKIDTEKEQELAGVFGIRSIPSVLLIPMYEKPRMAVGAMPKDSYIKAFDEVLGVKPVKN